MFSEANKRRDNGRFGAGAVLLGIGLGGLFDGIVLHQILQWHHMFSTPTPPVTIESLELNTLADGVFHAATWIVTVVGLFLVVGAHETAADPHPARRLIGGLLIGWGLFNVVEGVIDHHLLNIHHVRPGPDELLYDLVFLAWGAAMLVIGWALARPVGGRLAG